ncbi:hypothetical protein F5Y19DRAFT_194151 [Xylariaceae sp. FL1651]|nr:hypothetical protein F5Y19DRAFT_194151 [Xylariaceae sp. FL1651]
MWVERLQDSTSHDRTRRVCRCIRAVHLVFVLLVWLLAAVIHLKHADVLDRDRHMVRPLVIHDTHFISTGRLLVSLWTQSPSEWQHTISDPRRWKLILVAKYGHLKRNPRHWRHRQNVQQHDLGDNSAIQETRDDNYDDQATTLSEVQVWATGSAIALATQFGAWFGRPVRYGIYSIGWLNLPMSRRRQPHLYDELHLDDIDAPLPLIEHRVISPGLFHTYEARSAV